MSQARSGAVALLTNMRTLNLGNEVLSTELIALLDERYRVVAPYHRLSEIFGAALPTDDLVRWRERVDAECRRAQAATPPAAGWPEPTRTVTVGRRGERVVGGQGTWRHRVGHWVRWRTPVRRAFEQREGAAARAQLAQVVAADEVVYNPAGEMLIATPVSRFFELAVAARAGRPIAVVNFTYDPLPLTQRLAAEVLPAARVVFARDAGSAERLVADGVAADAVRVVADAAFLYRPPARGPGGGGIGLATNATLDSAQREGWRRVVELVGKDHDEVTFTSNAHQADVGFARDLDVAGRPPMGVGSVPADFRAYAAELARFDVVVTARFHTAVLCCVVGVPCVAVEGTNRRIRPALTGLLPDVQLVTTTAPDWPEAAAEATRHAVAPTAEAIEAVRTDITDAYAAAFPMTA